jgi:hypothetical protein
MQMIELDLTKAQPEGMPVSECPVAVVSGKGLPSAAFVRQLRLHETTRLMGQRLWRTPSDQLIVMKRSDIEKRIEEQKAGTYQSPFGWIAGDEWEHMPHNGSFNFDKSGNDFEGKWCHGCFPTNPPQPVHLHFAAPGCNVKGHDEEGCHVSLVRLRVVGPFEVILCEDSDRKTSHTTASGR